MARRTCADATRHARPRDKAARAHMRRKWCTGRGHVAGGHAGPRGSTRMPVWGTAWQEGSAGEGPTG